MGRSLFEWVEDNRRDGVHLVGNLSPFVFWVVFSQWRWTGEIRTVSVLRISTLRTSSSNTSIGSKRLLSMGGLINVLQRAGSHDICGLYKS